MDITLLMGFLEAVLGVVANNNISQNHKDNAVRYLSLLGALVQSGTEVNLALTQLTQRIKEQRPITDDEWAALKARSDAAHTAIQEPDSPAE